MKFGENVYNFVKKIIGTSRFIGSGNIIWKW